MKDEEVSEELDDVDAEDLNAVRQTAQGAATLASNASAEAAAKVAGVKGASPISASVGDDHVATVVHSQSGVTAGEYGPASDLAPGWGEVVAIAPRLAVNATGHVTEAEARTLKIPDATATGSAHGLMSASDKAKLDGLPSGLSASASSTTLEEGLQATAEVSVSGGRYAFEFGIPKGDTGVQGRRGTSITVGSGAPDAAAMAGDSYIDSTTGDLYLYQ